MPCPPVYCGFQADCPDTHCPGNPRGSGEHSDYWPRVNADFLPAMHAPLQPEPLPIMFAGPEPTEADERKDKPLYQLESIVPAWTKTTWALLSILTALCVVLVIVMVQGLN